MANDSRCVLSILAITAVLISVFALPTSVHGIGVCYGRQGDNLPPPAEVVALYESNNIGSMRIYGPDQDVLEALRGSKIELMVGVPKDFLPNLASDPAAANAWVQQYIIPFKDDVAFSYIAVGNELIPEDPDKGRFVLPAMENIQNALSDAGLQKQIKVSTAVSGRVLGDSSAPSACAFAAGAQELMKPIVQFLAQAESPLLFNVYPYFAYTDNDAQIQLPYALFTSAGVVVQDGVLGYQNLFDALVDSAYAALEKVGGEGVRIVASESGWPSSGGEGATVENASTYNQNLIRHVGAGTPRRPEAAVETYVFAMFNEDLKTELPIESNFGLFLPDERPVYPIKFT